MEYSVLLDEYAPAPTDAEVAAKVAAAVKDAAECGDEAVWRFCLESLDLTTLSYFDSERSVADFVRRAAQMTQSYPSLPEVATVCVYPSFVDIAGIGVEGTGIGVTSVAGSFPTSQTFLEVKMLEVAMAVENGADEIDVVMNGGELVEGEPDRLVSDLGLLREEAGEDTVFKVIIESGLLGTAEDVYRASLLAIFAGADFVKTSTGKAACGATPESAVVICRALKEYYRRTGKRVGIKIAGGVRTAEDAALYYAIVRNMLGDEWLTPSLFRIGASAPLASALISAITGVSEPYFK